MSQVASQTPQVDPNPQSLQHLRQTMETLQKDRQFHLEKVQEIDQAFMDIREQINDFVGQLHDSAPHQSPQRAKGNGPAKAKSAKLKANSGNRGGRGQTRQTRNGKETGTMAMIEILQKAGGSMSRKDLREQSEVAGVSSPYSSLYSLERSGKVSRDGDKIVLNAEEVQPAQQEAAAAQ